MQWILISESEGCNFKYSLGVCPGLESQSRYKAHGKLPLEILATEKDEHWDRFSCLQWSTVGDKKRKIRLQWIMIFLLLEQ